MSYEDGELEEETNNLIRGLGSVRISYPRSGSGQSSGRVQRRSIGSSTDGHASSRFSGKNSYPSYAGVYNSNSGNDSAAYGNVNCYDVDVNALSDRREAKERKSHRRQSGGSGSGGSRPSSGEQFLQRRLSNSSHNSSSLNQYSSPSNALVGSNELSRDEVRRSKRYSGGERDERPQQNFISRANITISRNAATSTTEISGNHVNPANVYSSYNHVDNGRLSGSDVSPRNSLNSYDRHENVRRPKTSPNPSLGMDKPRTVPDYFGMCNECKKMIPTTETACQAMGHVYHTTCFVCSVCGGVLKGKAFYNVNGKVFCEDDYQQYLRDSAEKCMTCGEPIMEMILQALGHSYHPTCFRCVECNCCLDGIPFTVDQKNKVHCIADYHKKYAPRCGYCGLPITPSDKNHNPDETVRIVAMDKDFHVECYRCEDCLTLLTDEEGKHCYPLEGHLLCRDCHIQRISN